MELKFRAWDGARFLYDGDLSAFKPVMVYSGVKDRTGRGIFEDDLVRITVGKPNRGYRVVFMVGAFCFSGPPIGHCSFITFRDELAMGRVTGREESRPFTDFLEVVGNVYESSWWRTEPLPLQTATFGPTYGSTGPPIALPGALGAKVEPPPNGATEAHAGYVGFCPSCGNKVISTGQLLSTINCAVCGFPVDLNADLHPVVDRPDGAFIPGVPPPDHAMFSASGGAPAMNRQILVRGQWKEEGDSVRLGLLRLPWRIQHIDSDCSALVQRGRRYGLIVGSRVRGVEYVGEWGVYQMPQAIKVKIKFIKNV